MKKSERTRKTLIDSAGRGFRRCGYSGVGIDSIAKEAGVTSGAFYAHLGSKDGAFRTVLADGLDEVIDTLPKYRAEHGDRWPVAFVDYYLGDPHRADLECGCAMTGLTPDVVRASPEIQAEYAAKMDLIVAEIVKGAPPGETDPLTRAWAFLSSLIGGLSLSRAVGSSQAARAVAEASKSTALAALGYQAIHEAD